MSEPVQMPQLMEGQFSVLLVETSTGILLNLDGSRRNVPGLFYLVFDTQREAEEFSEDYVGNNPGVECSIRDRKGDWVKAVRRKANNEQS